MPPASTTAQAFAPPLNLHGWIDDHRHLLKPPVGSRVVFQERSGATGDLVVQVVAGPVTRKDYHVNPTEELYYQIEGDLTLRCIDRQGRVHDVAVRAGEMFLLPPATPHAEIRPAGAVGLVVERMRPAGEDDHLRFYCDKCGSVVYDEQFEVADIAEQVRGTLERFWSDATLRTCVQCGFVVQHAGGPASPAVAQTTTASAIRKPAARALRPLAVSRSTRKGVKPGPMAHPHPHPRPPVRSPLAHAKKRVLARGR